MPKPLRRLVYAVGILYLILVAGLYFLQDHLLFFPHKNPFERCGAARAGLYRIIDETAGAHIRMYLRPGVSEKAGSIVLFHGNGSSACAVTYYAEALKDLKLNFFLAEYPGYSGDPTPPSQEALTRNSEAVFDYIQARFPGPVFVFGESLGTGVATYLASVRTPAGLILRTPYSSITDIASGRYPIVPISLLIRNPFPAEKWAESVKAPVLILHGTRDRTIPIEYAHRLEKHFSSPLRFITIEGVDHNDIQYRAPDVFWGNIISFVKGCLKGKCF